MGLTLTTPPAAEPVTLAELKSWARVDSDDDDDLLEGLISAAREYVETALGRQLVTATYSWTGRCFPRTLPRPPLQTVTTVKYKDAAGTPITLDAADYIVDTTADPGAIEPATSWPAVGDFPDAVQIVFTAGYADTTDSPPVSTVPERARIAIKALGAHWYDARQPVVVGASVAEVPLHVGRLINQAKTWAAP